MAAARTVRPGRKVKRCILAIILAPLLRRQLGHLGRRVGSEFIGNRSRHGRQVHGGGAGATVGITAAEPPPVRTDCSRPKRKTRTGWLVRSAATVAASARPKSTTERSVRLNWPWVEALISVSAWPGSSSSVAMVLLSKVVGVGLAFSPFSSPEVAPISPRRLPMARMRTLERMTSDCWPAWVEVVSTTST